MDQASIARVYDFLLGGHHHFAADRAAAAQLLRFWPEAKEEVAAQRAFLRRAVRYLVGEGIDQFLDIGSGIPTVRNVHEVAQALNPRAATVYVDRDPTAVRHARYLLAQQQAPHTVAVHGDVRTIESVLADADVRAVLDLARPVVVLLGYVLHFIDADDQAAGVIDTLRTVLSVGSAVVLSHATADFAPATEADRALRSYQATTAPLAPRPLATIAEWFDGWEVVEPGVVPLGAWRPDDGEMTAAGRSGYAAVAWNSPRAQHHASTATTDTVG